MNLLNRYVKRTEYASIEDFQNNFETMIPENFNYAFDVADEMARLVPEQLAVVWCNPEGEEKLVNFAEMKRLSDKAANWFRAQGIGKGDAVMLILKRHLEFWPALLALHKLGAVAIPATHLLTVKDLVYRNNAASVKMVVCTGDGVCWSAVEESLERSPTVQKIAMVANGVKENWLDYRLGVENAEASFQRPTGAEATKNDDISLMYFTSGTTGMPKMVMHNYVYPLGHIVTAKYWQNCVDGGLHLTVADTGWAKSVWGKLYGQWISGSAVMVYDYEKFVPAEMLDVITKYKVTTFCAPPTIYRFLIHEDMSGYDFSSLQYAVVAGEPLNPEVFHKFHQATGLELKECYGQTEVTVLVGTFSGMVPRPGSMGLPNPQYKVEIVDENGERCETGVVGEIAIFTGGGIPAGMFKGYYKDEERTKTMWHDGLYHTGDTAWRDEEGYYWYVGRMDDMIKSSGYRIGPFEVESALMEHPAVLETAITGAPDEVRGQVVKATIVLAKGYEPSEKLKKELQEHVKHTTAPYKYPRIVEFVSELPKTISGKIRRVELREEDAKKREKKA